DKAAAANVAGVGQHDLERESHRDGGVDRVATFLEDLDARLAGERMRRDDHRVCRGGGARTKRPRGGNDGAATDRGGDGGDWRTAAPDDRHRAEQSEDLSHSVILSSNSPT